MKELGKRGLAGSVSAADSGEGIASRTIRVAPRKDAEDASSVPVLSAGSAVVDEVAEASGRNALHGSAVPRSGGSGSEVRRVQGRRGVVSGFGSERTEDALGDQSRRDEEACARQTHRREEGLRGRARDWNDEDLDRSFGGPAALGRR